MIDENDALTDDLLRTSSAGSTRPSSRPSPGDREPARRAGSHDRRDAAIAIPAPRQLHDRLDHASAEGPSGVTQPRHDLATTPGRDLTTHGSAPRPRTAVRPVAGGRPRPRPEPPREDGDPLRGHARPVPRRPGPDDRRSGAADHRDRSCRGNDYYVWAITIYLLTSTISVPFWGKLSDIYGRKPIFMIGIVIFLIGSALVRPEPEHGDADPLPGHPGHRRRLAVPGRARRSSATCSRPRSAASTRACSGPCSASRSSPARSSAAS